MEMGRQMLFDVNPPRCEICLSRGRQPMRPAGYFLGKLPGSAFPGKCSHRGFPGEFPGKCDPPEFPGEVPGILDAHPWNSPGNGCRSRKSGRRGVKWSFSSILPLASEDSIKIPSWARSNLIDAIALLNRISSAISTPDFESDATTILYRNRQLRIESTHFLSKFAQVGISPRSGPCAVFSTWPSEIRTNLPKLRLDRPSLVSSENDDIVDFEIHR